MSSSPAPFSPPTTSAAISDQITKDVLQIPERYTRVCITPLGVPVEWPIIPSKKKLEEFISYETLK